VDLLTGAQRQDSVEPFELAGGRQLQVEVGMVVTADVEAVAAPRRRCPAAWLDADPDPGLAVEDDHRAEELAAGGGHVLGDVDSTAQHQRVGHAYQAGRRAHLRDQDAAVRFVALPGLGRAFGRDEEPPAPPVVKDRAEHRRGVEPRQAQPGDRSVTANECGGGAVTDQSVILQRQVPIGVLQRSERRRGVAQLGAAHGARADRSEGPVIDRSPRTLPGDGAA
jgi:hypothetical protein